ncbi:prepilin peptidase [Lachnospiraceae bacterium OttesenSCG-928-D06]|nr:prepilin peptidase [Lachnospiraceae bacterium OttesenSCG-928-D06]
MAALSVLLLAVCIEDYRSTKIPNRLLIFIAAAGIWTCYQDAGLWGIGRYFVVVFLVFLVFYPFFMIGAVGAGDVKLYALTAAYLSGKAILCFLVFSLLIAAIFSFIKVIKEHNGRERIYYFFSYIKEVVYVGKWRLYMQEGERNRRSGICLSGPILLSVLLHIGGAY